MVIDGAFQLLLFNKNVYVMWSFAMISGNYVYVKFIII